MKLFLFLDDYLLDSKRDVARVFPAAKLEKILPLYSQTSGETHYNVATKRYEAWAATMRHLGNSWEPTEPEATRELVVSEDGVNWTSRRKPGTLTITGEIPEGLTVTQKTVPCPPTYDRWHGLEYEDKWEEDPARRYKCVIWPFTRDISEEGGIDGGPGLIACSPDGMDWTADMRHQWFRTAMGSDTSNNIFYNPITRHWQVICRPRNLDRRIAMAESPDLENWTEPRVILHPEETDGPCTQFYGMPVLVYEDEYFIGCVDYLETSLGEVDEDHVFSEVASWSKWLGLVDGRLAYSYDGRAWWRPDRRNVLLPRTEPGEFGCGGSYCKTMEVGDDGTVNFYSCGNIMNHGVTVKGYPYTESTLMHHTMRHDGFCYLEPRGWGYIATRPLVVRGDDLTVNYQASVDGQVKVQVSDSHRNPLPGYTFDDCIPLTGNEVYGAVRWKEHRSLADLPVKDRVRIEFKFIDAWLYAVRIDCGLWFTNTPEPIERI